MVTVSHTPPPTEPTRPAGPLKLAWQFTLGVLFLLSVFLIGWAVFNYATSRFVSADATRVEERKKILSDRQAEDQKYLHDAPSWFAKDKGLVRVPIEEAMRMTLPRLQADKPHAAYPIETPPPDSGAPTSPDKGAGSTPGVNTNPPASNPTAGHPVPTPAPATAAPSPATAATPMAAPVSASPAPAATPANNAANPGSAPVPGTQPQPTPAPAPEVSPAPAATGPAPLATPPAQPTPPGAAPAGGGPAPTPTPAPNEPGANPAGTP